MVMRQIPYKDLCCLWCWILVEWKDKITNCSKKFNSKELVVQLWSASCKTIQSLKLRGDGLRRYNDIIWNGFPWSSFIRNAWMIYIKLEFVFSFPASLLFMNLDFDVISYLKGNNHLLVIYELLLYPFLLWQYPHKRVIVASSSAFVPTKIGISF
jgi:hypothetical protein